jgi:hypothetical protein
VWLLASRSLARAWNSGSDFRQEVVRVAKHTPDDHYYYAADVTKLTTGRTRRTIVNRNSISRIWRVRRRGQWIDATLDRSGQRWRVTFALKGRVLAAMDFDTRSQATDAARARLREFERAGWTEHW